MVKIRVLTSLILLLSFTSSGIAQEGMRFAEIIGFEGTVEIQREGEKYWVPAEKGMVLNEGDLLRTKGGSTATVDVTGITGEEITLEVQESSQIMIAELIREQKKKSHKTLIDLAIGKVLIRAKELKSEESEFEIKTPTSIVGIRGTTFDVEVEAIE